MTTFELDAADEGKVEEFAGNLFMAALATMELANVELGVRLGLYEALAGAGAVTVGRARLARGDRRALRPASGSSSRRSAGVVEVDDVTQPPDERRFTLPNAHAHVLTDDDSEACMKPCAAVVPLARPGDRIMVEGAFRTGTGVAFGDFDAPRHAGRVHPSGVREPPHAALASRPARRSGASCHRGERVRIAEVGCGEGLAAITIARTYPNAEIDGYDLDEASIAVARDKAADAGVGDRVRFEVRDAADPGNRR